MAVGDRFEIVDCNKIGVINSMNADICNVTFYNADGSMYANYDVYVTTITENMKCGFYKSI